VTAPPDLARVERLLGARVLWAEHVEGRGYTHTGRHRAGLVDGRSVFVKSAVDELSAGWLRAENTIYSQVEGEFLPHCLGYDERDGLPLLVLEDLGDAYWPPPWRAGDVEAVIHALEAMAAVPVPHGLHRVPRDEIAPWWREVEREPEPFLSLGMCSRAWLDAHLPELRDAAERAPYDGQHLIHLDVRSDNIALRDGRAILVDWNWACRSNPLLDRAGWCPSLQLEGGPAPEEIAPEPEAGEFAAGLAGLWASRAGLPPPPTATARLREMQAAQLGVALAWACRALGIEAPG
jgi:hypothetical protein